ncbi:MAG: efflux RND transporter periplasmic adaptor subunit [Porticoccaceae bacterium]
MKKIVLPLAIIAGAIVLSTIMFMLKPAPEKLESPEPAIAVKTVVLEKTATQLYIQSQGSVLPRTRTALISEVSGAVLEVSPQFVVGGVFRTGDILMQLDPTDYQVALQRAQARLISMNAQLSFEQARSAQAEKEWAMTGRPASEAPLLALRKPYLAEAQANVLQAEAEVKQAQQKLDKTTIRAPYAGMVSEKMADIGQFAAAGSRLGEIFAIDYGEVRLPMTKRDLSKLDIAAMADGQSRPVVTLRASVGGAEVEWSALLVRSEGVVDQRNRAQYLVAQVDDPYNIQQRSEKPALLMGTFVRASIAGKKLDKIFAVPRHALLEGDNIAAVDADSRLRLKKVEKTFGDDQFYYISNGLEEGVEIIVSAVGVAIDGMRVKPVGNQ